MKLGFAVIIIGSIALTACQDVKTSKAPPQPAKAAAPGVTGVTPGGIPPGGVPPGTITPPLAGPGPIPPVGGPVVPPGTILPPPTGGPVFPPGGPGTPVGPGPGNNPTGEPPLAGPTPVTPVTTGTPPGTTGTPPGTTQPPSVPPGTGTVPITVYPGGTPPPDSPPPQGTVAPGQGIIQSGTGAGLVASANSQPEFYRRSLEGPPLVTNRQLPAIDDARAAVATGVPVPLPRPRVKVDEPAREVINPKVEVAPPKPNISQPERTEPPPPAEPTQRECRVTVEKKPTKQLDILFIVDTSGSMDSVRAHLASQMREFVKSLDVDTDYRIGVMLAHGPKTQPGGQNNLFAELYSMETNSKKKAKGIKDQYVLAYSSFFEQEVEKEKRSRGGNLNLDDASVRTEISQRATNHIMEILSEKMTEMPYDHADTEGEAGLIAAYSAVTNPQYRDKIIKQGLFRTTAALVVFFITDENDVCYDYHNGETPHYNPKITGKPALGTPPRDPKEWRAFQGVCSNWIDGKRVQPELVLSALKSFKNSQEVHSLTVTGAIYVNDSTIPRDPKDKWKDEKEVGYGIKDIIEQNGNEIFDLAGENFTRAARELGAKVAIRMKLDNQVECNEMNQNIPQVDPVTFEAFLGEQRISVDRAQGYYDERRQKHVQAVLNLEELDKLVGDTPVEIDVKWKELAPGQSPTQKLQFKNRAEEKTNQDLGLEPKGQRSTVRKPKAPKQEKSWLENFFSR